MDYFFDKRFMIKYITLLLVLINVTSISTQGYGFDAGASCSTKNSRRGRARLLSSIPCDITSQGYCNQPGNLYPWHAVRRFVHENQGLMKRMYGDVRHISVLRNEISDNDIGLDDIEKTATRYSRSGWKRNKYLYQDHSRIKTNDILTEPHFRRAPTVTSRTTSTTNTPTSTITMTKKSTHKSSVPTSTTATSSTFSSTPSSSPVTLTTQKQTTASTTDASTLNVKYNNKRNTKLPTTTQMDNQNVSTNILIQPIAASNSFKNVTSTVAQNSNNIKIVGAPNLAVNKTVAATISTTLRIFGFQKNEEDEEEEEDITTYVNTEENSTESITIENDDVIANTTVEPSDKTDTVDSEDDDNDLKSDDDDSDADESIHTEEIVDLNGNKVNKPNRPSQNNAGQLFQDAVQKEEPAFVVNPRGVNACPVKEEVVAPFWANNTRGEVLALLNLYPFEQYVHWEKCTQEHKQMYCRDGCRCEQQYRLHRLLAYDPNNECRGIFSDWFRFPSCCVCKCYDIPLEYRVTSRSPRTMGDEMNKNTFGSDQQRHPIDIAEDEVHRAIYEHATSDWYRKSFGDDDDIDNNDQVSNDEEEDEDENNMNFY